MATTTSVNVSLDDIDLSSLRVSVNFRSVSMLFCDRFLTRYKENFKYKFWMALIRYKTL